MTSNISIYCIVVRKSARIITLSVLKTLFVADNYIDPAIAVPGAEGRGLSTARGGAPQVCFFSGCTE